MSADRQKLLVAVTYRLLVALGVCFAACVLLFVVFSLVLQRPLPTAFAVLLVGAVGGFVGIQRRLPGLTDSDLELLVASWEYILLAPFVGGLLAILLFCVFLSGLISGSLFPTFEYKGGDEIIGLARLFETRSDDFADYAKLIVWSFIAGYSESFVIGILGSLEVRVPSDVNEVGSKEIDMNDPDPQ